jgi:GT2 family glycosyltransferase
MTGASPLLSVILVNWNGGRVLNRCLGALLQAADGVPTEIILVDNGSSDGSLDLVSAFGEKVKAIPLGRNHGFAAGNNAGLRQAKGGLLLLLNTDTEMPRATLEAMVAEMKRDSTIGLLGCHHYDQEGRPQVSYQASFGGPLCRFTEAAPRPAAGEALEVAWISGACTMARREVYERVGGLDEDYPLYYEDVDWCYRARLAGWRVCWLGGVGLMHEVGGSSSTMTQERKRRLQVWSEAVFYRKHAGVGAWLFWLLTNLLSSYCGTLVGLLRFLLRPRRRTFKGLRHRWNEAAAFTVAAYRSCAFPARRGMAVARR